MFGLSFEHSILVYDIHWFKATHCQVSDENLDTVRFFLNDPILLNNSRTGYHCVAVRRDFYRGRRPSRSIHGRLRLLLDTGQRTLNRAAEIFIVDAAYSMARVHPASSVQHLNWQRRLRFRAFLDRSFPQVSREFTRWYWLWG